LPNTVPSAGLIVTVEVYVVLAAEAPAGPAITAATVSVARRARLIGTL